MVVAILAAIAGTATIILKDTDRQASAAAHVAMMDELSKGIQTFRVLNNAKFPDVYDSLLGGAAPTAVTGTLINSLVDAADHFDVTPVTLPEALAFEKYGITKFRVVDNSLTTGGPDGAANCADLKAAINNKANGMVPGNIFCAPANGGCGVVASISLLTAGALNGTPVLATWKTATNGRVNAAATDKVFAVGLGPDSTLFNPNIRGALSNTPVYRHVAADEYSRFIALLNIKNGEVQLQAIVDTAGDTKDEELGEWDGTRSTI